MILDRKRVVVTGGTGSIGRVIISRLLSGDAGEPSEVVIFSRGEVKQDKMRYGSDPRLRFRIGDVRDFEAVTAVLKGADVVIHAAAMKQVPACEETPLEAVRTNVDGSVNIVRAIRDFELPVEVVVFISTDKACKPINVYGMTKAISERILIQANLECGTRFVGVRFGNVLATRGSVIPLFHRQIRAGGPVTITSTAMTRFLMSIPTAADTVLAALSNAERGEIYVPFVSSARVIDLAHVLIDGRAIEMKVVGIRPGEKIHEELISEEEARRTISRPPWYVLTPELLSRPVDQPLGGSGFGSDSVVLGIEELADLIEANGLRLRDEPVFL